MGINAGLPFNPITASDSGLRGDGEFDNTQLLTELMAANPGRTIYFTKGSYKTSGIVYPSNINFHLDPGASFSGGEVNSSGVALGQSIPGQTIFGKLTIRDGDYLVSHTDGFLSDPDMGQVFRLDAKAAMGQCAFYLSNDKREPVISPIHYVCFHSRNNNTLDAPSLWGMNPVVVKNITNAQSSTGSASVIGVEISVSNNTNETPTPLLSGNTLGLFISYINEANKASAALATGGYAASPTAGWANGIWIDGIATNGRGIVLNDDVSANQGMLRGIDTSPVANFGEAAILLGNSHRLCGLTVGNTAIVPLIHIDNNDDVVLGTSGYMPVLRGVLEFADDAAAAAGGVALSGIYRTANTLKMRIA